MTTTHGPRSRSWTAALAIALALLAVPTTARMATAAASTETAATAAAGQPQERQDPPDDRPAGSAEPEARYAEEITVTGERERSLTAPSPEAAERELAAVPGGAAYVDAGEIRLGRASTLQDVLGFVPGVVVQPRFGAEEARLSIRGSGLQRTFHGRGLKLLQDGVPLNLADGGFDFQAVEPLTARYVEVFRGPNGLEHGASTLGGAINYVSPSGFEASPAEGRFEAGAFGYLRAQAAVAGVGGAGGRRDHYAALTHFAQEGFRDHAEQSTQRFFGNLGVRLRDDRETRFWLTAVATDSELPGSLTRAQLEADPRQAAPGNVALDQKRDFDLLRLANRTSLLLGSAARLDVGTFWSYKHLDHPIFQVLDQRSHDVGADVRYERAGAVGGRSNRLVLGLAPAVGVLEDERFQNVRGQRGARTARGETTSTNLDLYAEDRLELSPGLTLAMGAVASYAGRDFADDFLADGDQTGLQEFTGVSPKLGLLWDLSPRASLFATAARSFEPPSFGELANLGGGGLLELDAQTATSLEVGSRGRAGRLGWDVVLYHARLDDELLSLDDAQGNPLGTINAGRTVHAGLEAGLEARFGPAAAPLALRAAYTWSRFRFDGDPAFGDNRLAGLPEHLVKTELVWEHPRGWYGGPNVEWAPDGYPVDHANTLFAEGYTILGAKLGYRTERGLAGFVEGKNLTDETYAATTGVVADARGRDSAQFLPGDGASVFAGIEYRW